MKKITSREEIDKKERRNKTILSIILVGIMVLSTAGYALYQTGGNGSSEKIEYNGIKFVSGNGLWNFQVSDYDFATANNPKDVENITGYVTMRINNYNNKPLYFSYNSSQEAVNEILKNIGRFAERTQYVCMDNCEKNFAVKNCSDNIIIAEEANETLIRQENNCVYISSSKENVLKASDAFIFRILGIQ